MFPITSEIYITSEWFQNERLKIAKNWRGFVKLNQFSVSDFDSNNSKIWTLNQGFGIIIYKGSFKKLIIDENEIDNQLPGLYMDIR